MDDKIMHGTFKQAFEIFRQNPEDKKTFSKEVIESLEGQIQSWVCQCLMSCFEKNFTPHQLQLNAELTVQGPRFPKDDKE